VDLIGVCHYLELSDLLLNFHISPTENLRVAVFKFWSEHVITLGNDALSIVVADN
jgi:hypothetical protein